MKPAGPSSIEQVEAEHRRRQHERHRDDGFDDGAQRGYV